MDNPPCRAWCQDEHRPQEFTEGGALTCRKGLDEDDWFSVYVLQTNGVDATETPGILELTGVGIFHRHYNDEWAPAQADYRAPFAVVPSSSPADAGPIHS